MPVLSLVGFLVVAISTTDDGLCSAAAPCAPDLVVALGAGALVADAALVRAPTTR